MIFKEFLYLTVLLTTVLSKNNTNKFYQLDVGVDKNSLWYVNSSITNQDQYLRVDIAQPYVWVVDREHNEHSYVQTYEVNEDDITPFYTSDTVYNFSFIDNIDMNCTPYMSNMSVSNLQNNPFVQGDSSIDELVINSIGFMVAYDSHSLMAALGLSGPINNTNWQNNQVASDRFNSSFMFLNDLKEERVISHAGFSLWAAGDAYDEVKFGKTNTNYSNATFSNYSVGSLMMNYVNSSLFSGELVKFKPIPYYEVFEQGQSFSSDGYPIFPLSGCNIIANNSQSVNLTTTDTITPVLFDSRYTTSFLPIDIIQQISIQTNAFYVESVESWYVDCELAQINAEVEFMFGQLPIKVPLSEFITEAYLSNKDGSETPLYFKSVSGERTNACILKMKPSYLSGINILGVPFLKYSYLVGDLETNEYALAQAATFDTLQSSGDYTGLAKVKRNNEKDTSLLSTSTSSSTSSKFVIPSSLTATSKTSSISLPGDLETAKFMSSGYIPFAKSSNITETNIVLTTFSAASTQSKEYGSNILELFGYNFTYGSIFSNGEIITETKSFYETALSSYQLTTISGSTYYSAIPTKSIKQYSSDVESVYIVTVDYETMVTKIEGNTTLYGTSTLTVVTKIQSNETRSNMSKNLGNKIGDNNGTLLMNFVQLLCSFATILYII
ncbi:uncharacterized protein HGUI_02874 [Hanseniaspora guilliermondii]|uniref:Peptidase A1 domain-containing protein n=1 Tax=Hanseniaspora guilliermondii TaxID=56406 RepID=A0A1L0B2Q0_9ASCO|nr:uncharacterized protein HGUI_02874 [Hanseniaspora guilliermondii]